MTRSEVVKELKFLLEDFNAKFLHIVEYIEGDVDFREEDADFIIKTVCDVYGLTVEETLDSNRRGNKVDARHQMRYILRKYTKLTSKRIIQLTGATDHSTIYNSIERHEDLVFSDKDYKDKYDKVMNILSGEVVKRIKDFSNEEPK